jgi:hypothetical protein
MPQLVTVGCTMRIRLIPEARQWWRMLSVNLSVIGATVCGAWMITPAEQQAAILAVLGVQPGVVPLLGFLAVIVGRLVDQPKVREASETGGDTGAPLAALAALALAAGLAFAPQPAAAAPCAPADAAGGTGTRAVSGETATGWFTFHFCPTEYAVGWVATWGPKVAIPTGALADFDAARAGAASYAALRAKWFTGQQCELERSSGGLDVMVEAEHWDTHAELCFALRDAMAAAWPPAPVWRVEALLTGDGSRPMYPVVDGKRLTTAVQTPRAPGNALCPCTAATAIPSGSKRWCPVESRPSNLVALCTRRQ